MAADALARWPDDELDGSQSLKENRAVLIEAAMIRHNLRFSATIAAILSGEDNDTIAAAQVMRRHSSWFALEAVPITVNAL